MRNLYCTMSFMLALASVANGAPMSDDSYFLETFTSYPEHPSSSAPGSGVTTSGGNARVITTVGTEGVFRASPLSLPSEYVLEYDWTLHNPSTDNFYMLYNQGNSAPWESSIALRTLLGDATTWSFQIDHGTGYSVSPILNYGQVYHVTVHQKPGVSKPVDLYIDGSLIGTYDSRNPSLTTSLAQFGDPSSSAGYGDATIDNVSIGNPVAVPEPASIGLIAVGAVVVTAMRRRNAVRS